MAKASRYLSIYYIHTSRQNISKGNVKKEMVVLSGTNKWGGFLVASTYKGCSGKIHCNPSLAYIADRDLQSSQCECTVTLIGR